jgi:hypothetical protein
MPSKKGKKTKKETKINNSDDLKNLGIFLDDDGDEEIDEKESWRYYG